MKRVAFAAACLVLLSVATAGAWANSIPPQVTLSTGSNGRVSFTNNGGTIDVSLTGTTGQCGHANCVSGTALLDLGTSNITGKYWMWLVGGPFTLTGGPSSYSVDMGTSTLYLEVKLGPNGNGSQGDLQTTLTLSNLGSANTSAPGFFGSFWATTSTMSFSSNFPTDIAGETDFAVKLPNFSTLGPLKNGQTITGYVSSGELVPTVPEPSSLALMGTGVVGLAGLIRRKLR